MATHNPNKPAESRFNGSSFFARARKEIGKLTENLAKEALPESPFTQLFSPRNAIPQSPKEDVAAQELRTSFKS